MFRDAHKFNQDISKWNVSKVTNMCDMFMGAYDFNTDIGKWNVSKVTNMSGLFYDTKNFNQNISKWNVREVCYMQCMFMNAIKFNQDISKWKIHSVSNKTNVFKGATDFNLEYSPFPKTIRKKTIKKPNNLNSEENKSISKVKKFLIQRDYEQIDIGIELIRSLNQLYVFKLKWTFPKRVFS